MLDAQTTSASQSLFIAENPLINPPVLPHGVPALDKIGTEHIVPAVRWGIEVAREKFDAIRDSAAEPTFENTLEAMVQADTELTRVSRAMANLGLVKMSKEYKEAEKEAKQESSRFFSEISMDTALFRRVEAVYNKRDALGLDEEQMMLLTETYKSYVRSGVHLPDDVKERLKAINERMQVLSTDFDTHTVDAYAAYKKLVTDEDLDGVPQRAKNIYRQQAIKDGHAEEGAYLLTLQPYPMDIIRYAKNRELRKEIHCAKQKACYKTAFDNTGIMEESLKLLHEKAKLLGYENYAAYVLEDRMAGDVATVDGFLERCRTTYWAAAEKELEDLKAFALKRDGLTDFQIWDLNYYVLALQEEKFDFKPETLRPYFELSKVLAGAFGHAEKLFNIEFRAEKTGRYPTYHEDVQTFEVMDKTTGGLVGIFYFDPFARPGEKSSGAWAWNFRNRGLYGGKDKCPLVINCLNFDQPTPEQPALLSFGDVTTVFHELGHGLHSLLSEGKYPNLNGTSVKRDFVELPSQLMENWASEPEVLATFAHHYQTGEVLPTELVAKLKETERFCAGSFSLRQTSFALLDMAYYTIDPATMGSVEAVERRAAENSVLLKCDGGMMASQFGHIFAGGYRAGYYSYKWAEVLEADVFSVFKEKGLYDPTLSAKLREEIYSKGGTRPAMKLFEAFMGRRPDPDAMFKREGVLALALPDRPDSGQTGPQRPHGL